MKIYIGGVKVADADVIYQRNGKTIAHCPTEIAIEMDNADRIKCEAVLETATRYAFAGTAGTAWAGYIDEKLQWCTWFEGASIVLRSGLTREDAIEDAFNCAWADTAGGVS